MNYKNKAAISFIGRNRKKYWLMIIAINLVLIATCLVLAYSTDGGSSLVNAFDSILVLSVAGLALSGFSDSYNYLILCGERRENIALDYLIEGAVFILISVLVLYLSNSLGSYLIGKLSPNSIFGSFLYGNSPLETFKNYLAFYFAVLALYLACMNYGAIVYRLPRLGKIIFIFLTIYLGIKVLVGAEFLFESFNYLAAKLYRLIIWSQKTYSRTLVFFIVKGAISWLILSLITRLYSVVYKK